MNMPQLRHLTLLSVFCAVVCSLLLPFGLHAQEAGTDQTPLAPSLNVPIPGLVLDQSDAANSPLLAQYISAVARYLISASSIAATIMFVYGAFIYLLGSALPSLSRGKQIMMDAVLGMVLVLGSALILHTINPSLGKLETINILVIEGRPFTLDTAGGDTDEPLQAVPTAENIYCPKSGGSQELRKIVSSHQGKIAYRFGGKGGPPPYDEDQAKLAGTLEFNTYCPEKNLCLDCSGFVTYILQCAGLPVHKPGGTGAMFQGAGAEAINGYDLGSLKVNDRLLEPGDLLGWRKGGAGHVFIYIGNGLIADSKSGIAGRQPGANPRVQQISERHFKAFTHIIRIKQ